MYSLIFFYPLTVSEIAQSIATTMTHRWKREDPIISVNVKFNKKIALVVLFLFILTGVYNIGCIELHVFGVRSGSFGHRNFFS